MSSFDHLRFASVRKKSNNRQLELDIGASRGYPFHQFAIVIRQARFNQRSVDSLNSAKKGVEAGTCGRYNTQKSLKFEMVSRSMDPVQRSMALR
jgi:hypothetical protein